jgi:hypothetical protein
MWLVNKQIREVRLKYHPDGDSDQETREVRLKSRLRYRLDGVSEQ